jgi:hypothetical protein
MKLGAGSARVFWTAAFVTLGDATGGPEIEMRRYLLSILAALALATAAPAQDDGAAAIQDTIQSQFEAFKADDFARAFTYASPTIQGIFGTAENFGRMVRNGYPMVWRPAEVRFLDLHPKNGGLWQKVMVTDQDGGVHILDYEMIATEDGVRIGGVELLRQPDVGA